MAKLDETEHEKRLRKMKKTLHHPPEKDIKYDGKLHKGMFKSIEEEQRFFTGFEDYIHNKLSRNVKVNVDTDKGKEKAILLLVEYATKSKYKMIEDKVLKDNINSVFIMFCFRKMVHRGKLVAKKVHGAWVYQKPK